jgi:phage-related protein
VDWFLGLERKTQAKCKARLDLLSREGFGLRRPVADFLRDGVYELRLKSRGINFRVLYFFYGRDTVVVSHGFSKQGDKVPPREIKRAINNMVAFTKDPAKHTFE